MNDFDSNFSDCANLIGELIKKLELMNKDSSEYAELSNLIDRSINELQEINRI